MAMINSFYIFAENELNLIKELIANGLTYHDWGQDDLMQVRSNLRDFYRLEQKGKCAYCMQPISLQAAANAQVEHILPKSLHFEFMFEPKNLCVICADCNLAKRDKAAANGGEYEVIKGDGIRYPKSSDRFLIVHPAIDDYFDHIVIRGKHYINKTNKGHYMIGVCHLNRYVEKFGYKQEALDEYELANLLNAFANGDGTVRREVFDKLKEIIM